MIQAKQKRTEPRKVKEQGIGDAAPGREHIFPILKGILVFFDLFYFIFLNIREGPMTVHIHH